LQIEVVVCRDAPTSKLEAFRLTDEEVDQSMEYQASLIRHRLDTAQTTSDVSDVNPSEDENSSNPPDDNSTIAYQLANGRMRRRMWGWQSRWIGSRILVLIRMGRKRARVLE